MESVRLISAFTIIFLLIITKVKAGEGISKQKKAMQKAQQEIESDPLLTDLNTLFSFGDVDIWEKKYMQDRITVHLIKKSWKPSCGPSSRSDDVSEPLRFEQTLSEQVKKCLDESSSYDSINQPINGAKALLSESDFNKDLPNIFIFPSSTADRDIGFVPKTVKALAMRNLHRTHNLFTFDLSKIDFNMFMTVLNTHRGHEPSYNKIAAAVVDFFVDALNNNKMSSQNIHLIGWGFAGQLIGYVGRLITEKSSKKIGSIVALNPLSNINNEHMTHVSKSDADIVYVYHTNSFPIGSAANAGTADFIFNGGFLQPECKEDDLFCSHDGIVKRLWYIILFGGNLFEARQCESLVNFSLGLCNEKPTFKLTYPLSIDPVNGKYYIRTLAEPPYGEASKGSVNDPETKEKLQNFIQGNQSAGSVSQDLMMYMTWILD